MTQARHERRTKASSGGAFALSRRAALIWLMLGWSVFWLVATLQPCCQLAAAQSHTTAAGAHHDGSGHHPDNPADHCGSIAAVAHAPLIAATPAPAKGQATQAALIDALLPRIVEARAGDAYIAHPSLPPPRAVAAFHQRTSRIAI